MKERQREMLKQSRTQQERPRDRLSEREAEKEGHKGKADRYWARDKERETRSER